MIIRKLSALVVFPVIFYENKGSSIYIRDFRKQQTPLSTGKSIELVDYVLIIEKQPLKRVNCCQLDQSML